MYRLFLSLALVALVGLIALSALAGEKKAPGTQVIWRGDSGKFIDFAMQSSGPTLSLTIKAHGFALRNKEGLQNAKRQLGAATDDVMKQLRESPQYRNIAITERKRSDAPSGNILVRTVELSLTGSQVDKAKGSQPQSGEADIAAMPKTDKSAQKNHVAQSAGTTNDSGHSIVIAEGVGTTPSEALKDAYRNAVRQVVGAVVDAETFVKNDDVIDDKILTYSDGFVKTYEEVPGSKNFHGGLHRLKIKATVERRSIVAKLRAATITVKKVDGKGLFAEAITQLDAEQNMEAILRKEFDGFPLKLLTATAGKPTLVDKTADKAIVQIPIRLEPDMKAYKAFVERLTAKLDKIAKDKGQFTAVFLQEKARQEQKTKRMLPGYSWVNGGEEWSLPFWMPKSFEGSEHSKKLKPNQITLAIATHRSQAAERLECRYYILDKSVQPLLVDVAFRRGSGKLALLNGAGDVVLGDTFPLSERWLLGANTMHGTLATAYGMLYGARLVFFADNRKDVGHLSSDADKFATLFWITPMFMTGRITCVPFMNINRTMSMSLDELKAVTNVKCEITFGN